MINASLYETSESLEKEIQKNKREKRNFIVTSILGGCAFASLGILLGEGSIIDLLHNFVFGTIVFSIAMFLIYVILNWGARDDKSYEDILEKTISKSINAEKKENSSFYEIAISNKFIRDKGMDINNSIPYISNSDSYHIEIDSILNLGYEQKTESVYDNCILSKISFRTNKSLNTYHIKSDRINSTQGLLKTIVSSLIESISLVAVSVVLYIKFIPESKEYLMNINLDYQTMLSYSVVLGVIWLLAFMFRLLRINKGKVKIQDNDIEKVIDVNQITENEEDLSQEYIKTIYNFLIKQKSIKNYSFFIGSNYIYIKYDKIPDMRLSSRLSSGLGIINPKYQVNKSIEETQDFLLKFRQTKELAEVMKIYYS